MENQVYIVFDTAFWGSEVFEKIKPFFKETFSLLDKKDSLGMDSVTPYLCPIQTQEPLQFIADNLLGKEAIVFFLSTKGTAQIHTYLKNLFIVQDENLKEYFFRFFDAKALHQYLKVCSISEANNVLEIFDFVIAESSDNKTMTSYSIQHGELCQEELPIDKVFVELNRTIQI
jgi:hypothetical protein